MSTTTYKITDGTFKTYDFLKQIKKAGGKWDAATKSWTVSLYKSDSLHNYNGRLTFTEVSNNKPQQTNQELFNEFMHVDG